MIDARPAISLVRASAAAVLRRRPAALAAATLLLAAIPAMPPVARGDDGGGAVVIIDDFKYPEYDADGRVEFILHGRRARKTGVLTHIEEARLEWIEEQPGSGGTTPEARILKVIGTVTTPAAIYDEASDTISGEQAIQYRSADMDVDGIGFDVRHLEQTLHVRSKVRVVLRDDLRTDAERADDTPGPTPTAEGTQE
jgi:hypothetical protein